MKTFTPAQTRFAHASATCLHETGFIEQPFDIPDSSEPLDEPDDPSDLDDFDPDEDDDTDWDVFIPDDDEYDPEPDLHDFDADLEHGAWRDEPE
jgi:hypothetical protein